MKPNLFGVALIAVGFLFIDAAVNSRSPVDVVKAIMTGKPIPGKGSATTASAPASPGTPGSTTNPTPPPGTVGV